MIESQPARIERERSSRESLKRCEATRNVRTSTPQVPGLNGWFKPGSLLRLAVKKSELKLLKITVIAVRFVTADLPCDLLIFDGFSPK